MIYEMFRIRTLGMRGQVGSFLEVVATLILLVAFIVLALFVVKYILGIDIKIPFFS